MVLPKSIQAAFNRVQASVKKLQSNVSNVQSNIQSPTTGPTHPRTYPRGRTPTPQKIPITGRGIAHFKKPKKLPTVSKELLTKLTSQQIRYKKLSAPPKLVNQIQNRLKRAKVPVRKTMPTPTQIAKKITTEFVKDVRAEKRKKAIEKAENLPKDWLTHAGGPKRSFELAIDRTKRYYS